MSSKNNVIALKSILYKEVNRFMRIWVQTLVPPAITISLYFVIFGELIGSRIGQMGGFDYMSFIVPGLIMMSVITNSYSNVASSFFSAKWQRNVEEMLVAPVPNWVIVAGYVGGGMARGMLVGAIVTLVSLLFVDIQIHNIFVIMGDGECNEGSVWEALMAAPNFNLGNITLIIDKNNFQQTGNNKSIMDLGNLKNKVESFGWNTTEIDGHNINKIYVIKTPPRRRHDGRRADEQRPTTTDTADDDGGEEERKKRKNVSSLSSSSE